MLLFSAEMLMTSRGGDYLILLATGQSGFKQQKENNINRISFASFQSLLPSMWKASVNHDDAVVCLKKEGFEGVCPSVNTSSPIVSVLYIFPSQWHAPTSSLAC